MAVAHEVRRDGTVDVTRHTQDGGDGEAAWSDTDKHPRSGGFSGKFVGHESVEIGAVDHDADHETDSLDGETSEDDLKGTLGREGRR